MMMYLISLKILMRKVVWNKENDFFLSQLNNIYFMPTLNVLVCLKSE
ncbi:unnamed protein product [Trichobilharzia regenti]|nr:unnamed protein product [Trichobilharzia regenti]